LNNLGWKYVADDAPAYVGDGDIDFNSSWPWFIVMSATGIQHEDFCPTAWTKRSSKDWLLTATCFLFLEF